MNTIRTACLSLLVLFACTTIANGQSPDRSWHTLTTGNGHGFQLFNRIEGKLDQFLEHPYRYLAPYDERRDGGVSRRDLMHDAYFGLRVNGTSTWLDALRTVDYEDQSHIIKAQDLYEGLELTIRYFAPFKLEANTLVMILSVHNPTADSIEAEAIAKVNLMLGTSSDRRYPGSEQESITSTEEMLIETGPGGGHALYLPLDSNTRKGCGEDSTRYAGWLESGSSAGEGSCNGNNQVTTFTKSMVIEANSTVYFGLGVVFLNDNPNEPQADDFRDERTIDDVFTQWQSYINNRDAEQIIADTKSAFESWRVVPSTLGLNHLTDDEVAVWRQSETVLRMGQVRERTQDNRRNFGMFLAALPPGEWHIGWVRDGAYAIVAQAMAGHLSEARMGVEFFLNAWAGFFNSPRYLGRNYRISSVRYYGNGKEEGDFNADGPNVETDGFGLVLWAARAYLHYSCDVDWLDTNTLHGDSIYEALTQTAEEIDALLIDDLPAAECSIWETHWNYREVFTYTAATQIRGLYDFAAVARFKGDTARANYFYGRAQAVHDASLQRLIHPEFNSFVSHLNVADDNAFVDGSTIEMLSWDFVSPTDPLYLGTMNEYQRLQTPFGGYKRLEQQLSLTGDGQASQYDLSQWVLLDLRIGQAFRKMGRGERADELLQFVTDSAVQNDHLVPELFNPNDGRYEGAIPMVGYGAGAWQVAQLEKYGYPFPDVNQNWNHCVDEPVEPPPMDSGTAPQGPEDAMMVTDAHLQDSGRLDADHLGDSGLNTVVDGSVADVTPTRSSGERTGCIQKGDQKNMGNWFLMLLMVCLSVRLSRNNA
jgi:hypothetical protein